MPRLRAELTGVMVVFESKASVGLLSLDSCWEVPMIKNYVLFGLSESKLADIHNETWAMTD